MKLFLSIFVIFFSISAQAEKTKIDKSPVFIGFDGAFGQKTNTAAPAIELGIKIAINEINSQGGVLNGRPLKLITSDNKGVSARGKDNFVQLAKQKDVVAILGGKYSPITTETIPEAQKLQIPLISVWGSADQITEHSYKPSFTFRVSLKDDWGVEAMIKRISTNLKVKNACAFLPNTSWGRSADAVIKSKSVSNQISFTSVRWYNWGDSTFRQHYKECLESNGQALMFVGNEKEGAILFKEVASMPISERLPIISHWGVSGGIIHELAGDALSKIKVDVIQTFTFIDNKRPQAIYLANQAINEKKLANVAEILSPVGVAQAYDTVHLIKLAVEKAQSTEGNKIRDALENLPTFSGAIRDYSPAFTQSRHEALSVDDVIFVNIQRNGTLNPVR